MLGTVTAPDAEGNASGVRDGMIGVTGGTFRKGSDRHCPGEAPAVTLADADLTQASTRLPPAFTLRQFLRRDRSHGFNTFVISPGH